MIILITSFSSIPVDLSTKMADPESQTSTLDIKAWKALFESLRVQDDGNGAIKISDLEKAVEGIKSQELRANYNIKDYQFRR